MELSPRAAELTSLLESKISNFYTNLKVDDIGRVVSVGDGIALVYRLNEIQAGEMVEFASGVKGIALNLENENVGIVVFGSDTAIKEGDLVKQIGSIMDVPAGKAMLGRVVDALGVPIDGRGALSDHERRRVKVKAPGIIERKSIFIWLIQSVLLALLYFLSIQLGEISLIYKLEGSTLSSFLFKMGCSSGIAFGMVLLLKYVLTAEVAPNMVLPNGTEAGASGATWKEDTEEINILMESSWETEDTG